MTPPTLDCARHIRDGGIDAVAALDAALGEAIVGLSPEHQKALKDAFGHVMGEVIDGTINPAVRAFPELKPDEKEWASIAKSRAKRRSSAD